MSEFKSILEVRLLPETSDPKWQLINPLIYFSDLLKRDIIVPAGFITDFVSFGPLKNLGQRAAVLHDYLYSCWDFERDMADAIFLEALTCIAVAEELATAMYGAVRVFGGTHKGNSYTFYRPGEKPFNITVTRSCMSIA